MRSRFSPCLALLPLVLVASGCGYVHIGKIPEQAPTVLGDARLMAENSELKLEKKMLQQELALSRAQGDALRYAVENRTADGDTSRRLVQQLNDTTRELTQLRATHTRLLAERSGPAGAVGGANSAASAELNEELTRLRGDLARTREQNLVLTREVQAITAQHAQAQAALAQLNADLLSQREARQRAESDVDLLRTELRNVAPNSSALGQLRSGAASEARTIAPAAPRATAANGGPAVVSPETRRIELAAEPQIPVSSLTSRPASGGSNTGVTATLVARAPGGERTSAAVPAAGDGPRTHVVTAGDTLAKIATRYYGSAARWREILEANRDVLGEGNNLVVGHSLRIP